MAKGRKTIEVEWIKDRINTQLAEPSFSQPEKMRLCFLLEDVLHQSNNYNGFQFNYWNDGGYKAWLTAGEPSFPEKEKYITNNKKEEYSRIYY